MKLGKYTFGKNTATLLVERDWEGISGVVTVSYRHVADVRIQECDGETYLTVNASGQNALFQGHGDDGHRLREFAAELSGRMESCW